jgi:hypothetical protein
MQMDELGYTTPSPPEPELPHYYERVDENPKEEPVYLLPV